jgi:hypothetical protein
MNDDPNKIRITLDDLQSVAPPDPVGAPSVPQRQWGSVQGAATPYVASPAQTANFFLKAWVYLGIAGLAGAFLAWAICEPTIVDQGPSGWGDDWLFPLVITFMCVGFAVAEGVVERSLRRTVIRGLLALVLGCVLGFIFNLIANFIYNWGLNFLSHAIDDFGSKSPACWVNRAIAWMVFGVTGGIVYGIAGRSGKKCLYGVIGGMAGAGFGGLLFDPISNLTGGGGPSRCIGLIILGASTGVAMGLVESALKDRWLYVSAGPLAGKQFILYKPMTHFGRDQVNEIYLFKDLTILPQHATIDLRGGSPILTAQGATLVNGQPAMQCALRSGDVIQIGRYSFQYQEKQRAA